MRVESRAFFKAVDYVARAVARGGPPAMTKVLIEADGDRLKLQAGDLEVVVETWMPGAGGDAWKALVDPMGFRALKALAGESVELAARPAPEHDPGAIELAIAASTGVEVALASLNPDEWPDKAIYTRMCAGKPGSARGNSRCFPTCSITSPILATSSPRTRASTWTALG